MTLTIGLVIIAVLLVAACTVVLVRRSRSQGSVGHDRHSAARLDAQARGHAQRNSEGFGPP